MSEAQSLEKALPFGYSESEPLEEQLAFQRSEKEKCDIDTMSIRRRLSPAYRFQHNLSTRKRHVKRQKSKSLSIRHRCHVVSHREFFLKRQTSKIAKCDNSPGSGRTLHKVHKSLFRNRSKRCELDFGSRMRITSIRRRNDAFLAGTGLTRCLPGYMYVITCRYAARERGV